MCVTVTPKVSVGLDCLSFDICMFVSLYSLQAKYSKIPLKVSP